ESGFRSLPSGYAIATVHHGTALRRAENVEVHACRPHRHGDDGTDAGDTGFHTTRRSSRGSRSRPPSPLTSNQPRRPPRKLINEAFLELFATGKQKRDGGETEYVGALQGTKTGSIVTGSIG